MFLLTIALLLYDHHNMIVFWSIDTNPENSVLIKNNMALKFICMFLP